MYTWVISWTHLRGCETRRETSADGREKTANFHNKTTLNIFTFRKETAKSATKRRISSPAARKNWNFDSELSASWRPDRDSSESDSVRYAEKEQPTEKRFSTNISAFGRNILLASSSSCNFSGLGISLEYFKLFHMKDSA